MSARRHLAILGSALALTASILRGATPFAYASSGEGHSSTAGVGGAGAFIPFTRPGS